MKNIFLPILMLIVSQRSIGMESKEEVKEINKKEFNITARAVVGYSAYTRQLPDDKKNQHVNRGYYYSEQNNYNVDHHYYGRNFYFPYYGSGF